MYYFYQWLLFIITLPKFLKTKKCFIWYSTKHHYTFLINAYGKCLLTSRSRRPPDHAATWIYSFKIVKFVKLYNKLCSSAVYQFAYTKYCNTRWILFFLFRFSYALEMTSFLIKDCLEVELTLFAKTCFINCVTIRNNTGKKAEKK